MAKKKELDINTEAKIKNAAKNVFHKKGFAATRTRDIAEAAGINLALLNYYFRSKEKLFHIIIQETMQDFMKSFHGIFNDEKTTLDGKLELVASHYIDLLVEQPDIPIFILSEIRNNPEELKEKFQSRHLFFESVFAKQFQKEVEQGKIVNLSMSQFMMNLMGLLVFPFVASPLIKATSELDDTAYQEQMLQRKKLFPIWMKRIMYTKEGN